MGVAFLQLTAHDPIIARDGRPFGAGQGNRMRSLDWPLPSVVAGSFRTALVKAHPDLDFGADMPQGLQAIEVAGVFPTEERVLYLPAPQDCVWDKETGRVFRVQPIPLGEGEGVDVPVDGLDPVMLTQEQAPDNFKPKTVPAWWPIAKYAEWLTGTQTALAAEWFNASFCRSAQVEIRDHVSLDAETGAAAAGHLFSTAGLNVMHLPRYRADDESAQVPFSERFARVVLSARATLADARWGHLEALSWHPLGGERRLVHWQSSDAASLWACPDAVTPVLQTAARIRMVLATPAVFAGGWKPGWLTEGLEGTLPGTNVKLRLVGACNGRWKAVSGWSLARINDKGQLDPNGRPGPKAIRRMVPAGSVYFFQKVEGDPVQLADRWLQPVSDDEQERRDGFGLAIWGTW